MASAFSVKQEAGLLADNKEEEKVLEVWRERRYETVA